MLVLTRRVNESIVIDGNIIVTLLGIEGDKVKLGIAAPRSISVFRQELHDGIQAQEALQSKLAGEATPPESFKALRDLLAAQAADEEETPPEAPAG